MSVPIPGGSPDWQSYTNWRGTVFASGNQNISASSPYTISEYVTNYASIFLRASTSVNPLTVTVQFYTDNTLATLVETYPWKVDPGTKLSVLIPVVGNFAVFTLSTTVASAAAVALTIAPSNVAVPAPRYPVPGNGIQGNGVSVPGNGILTSLLPQIMEGEGILTVNPHAGGAAVIFKVYSLVGGIIQDVIAEVNNPGGPATAQFMAPNNSIQFEIDNNNAGAELYDYSVRVVAR